VDAEEQQRSGDKLRVPQHLQRSVQSGKGRFRDSAAGRVEDAAKGLPARRSSAKSTSAKTLGRKSMTMQMAKMRKACWVALTLRKGVNGRTVILDRPVCASYQSIQLNVSRKNSQSGLAR
jgi:hypothetical protein